MTPGAQIAAAIELLESVEKAWGEGRAAPADAMMGDYFRKRRFIGSKDKAAISGLFYTALRQGASLQWWVEQAGLRVCPRSIVLAALVVHHGLFENALKERFSGEGYCPSKLSEKELSFIKNASKKSDQPESMPDWMRLNIPEWCLPKFKELFGDGAEDEITALNTEAPLDLRVNTLKTTRDEALRQLKAEGFSPSPTSFSPLGLRLNKRGAIFNTRAFKAGIIEVQDEGSQLAALLVDAKPGHKVIDFCAGAGGKTLALAAQMQNKGRILAWDTSEARLSQTPKRLKRAGVDNVQRHALQSERDAFIKRHKNSADRVLIDAPCSGSGTWRRNPDLKWRFSPEDLDEILAVQRQILESACRLVKPGGRMVYVTCSLFLEENEKTIHNFLSEHDDFRVVTPLEIWNNEYGPRLEKETEYLRLTPRQHGTDGFFAVALEKQAV